MGRPKLKGKKVEVVVIKSIYGDFKLQPPIMPRGTEMQIQKQDNFGSFQVIVTPASRDEGN